MDSRKINKISEIVKLQMIASKWRKLAKSRRSTKDGSTGNNHKSIKFLKKTLSFSDRHHVYDYETLRGMDTVPKGFLAVSVGEELRRFVIPMQYLGHRAFKYLLKEAEEEFGFQQTGVLRIPCEVAVFEKILEGVAKEEDVQGYMFAEKETLGCYSSGTPFSLVPQSPMCR